MTELIPLGIAIFTVAAARHMLKSASHTVITCPTCGKATNLGSGSDTRVREQMTVIALDHHQHATTR